MEVRDRLFIGNEWVEPATDAVIEVISPISEEVYARTPDAAPADIDRAVDSSRAAFESGPWASSTPEERADALTALSQALQNAPPTDRRDRDQRERDPGATVDHDAGVRGDDGPRHLCRHRSHVHLERRPNRHARAEGAGPARSGRGLCRDHSVERAVVHHGDEAGPVPRIRLHDGAQACTGDCARPPTCWQKRCSMLGSLRE